MFRRKGVLIFVFLCAGTFLLLSSIPSGSVRSCLYTQQNDTGSDSPADAGNSGRVLLIINGIFLITLGLSSAVVSRSRISSAAGDFYCMAFLITVTVIYGLLRVNFDTTPFEDAAMLMRYARHYALGHGIVWNIGEKPIDGATDFLFMIVAGTLMKCGISLELSTRLPGILSHFSLIILVYGALRIIYRSTVIPAFFSAFYVAIGPGLHYTAAYFGTSFFALFGCLTWCFALLIMERNHLHVHAYSAIFSLCGLITALIRPEGVLLTGFILLAILYHNGFRNAKVTVCYWFLFFLLLGGAYFIWRWDYFGYPLPNPFYKKGDGHLYFNGLVSSVRNTVKMGLPFVLCFSLGFRSEKTVRRTVACFVPIAGFAASFILISNEMNFGARFQYVLLPMLSVSWFSVCNDVFNSAAVPRIKESLMLNRLTILFILAALMTFLAGYSHYAVTGTLNSFRDGLYNMGMLLSRYSDKGYTLATSEAGLLPLYSQWRAYDTWGLNDQKITHDGGITIDYLDRIKPHIIMFHAYFSPSGQPRVTGDWDRMTAVLHQYAAKGHYILSAAFCTEPDDVHYYYVRPDFTGSIELREKIAAVEYFWNGTRKKAINVIAPVR